jgi:hypothetical protein
MMLGSISVEQRREVGCDHVDHVHLERRASVQVRPVSDRVLGPVAVAAVLLRDRAQRLRRIVDDLPFQVGRDLAAADGHRRRGPQIALRSHGEHVGCLADPDAGGCRPCAGGDEDDDRDREAELFLVDVAHRFRETARSVEHDHRRGVATLLGALELVGHVIGRDRIDVVIELDRKHARRRSSARRLRGEQGGCEERQRREKRPHFVRILSAGASRPWRRPPRVGTLARSRR